VRVDVQLGAVVEGEAEGALVVDFEGVDGPA
jgi:hypothetical protein